MQDELWQCEAVCQLGGLLSEDEGVRGLLLIGSCSRHDISPDAWSDVDIAVIVDDASLARFYPTTEWVRALGEPYAFSLSQTDSYGVIRAQFTDGRRIDFVVASQSSLERIAEWDPNPLRYGGRLLMSRSPALDRVLTMAFTPPTMHVLSEEQFRRLANDFWFKGMLATSKAARAEMLVAAHLSLDMVRDCLFLAMALRDRATGTNRHRDGRHGNHYVEELAGAAQPYSAQCVLTTIEQSAAAFDRLASEWTQDWREGRGPLLEWVRRARRSLANGTS
jgi:hypothetical protein